MRDGWVDKVLGELAEITTGSRAKGGAITSGIPSIGGEQIAEDRSIKFNKMKFIPKDHFESMRTGTLKFGDSLLVKDGATTGKVGFWDYDIPAAVNEHVFILRAKPDCAEPYFINLLISHRPFRKEIESRTRGIIGGITKDIKNIELVVPPLPEQKRIVDLISSVDSYIEALQQLLESAKRSRNAVLHELLTVGGDDWIETCLDGIAEYINGYPFKPADLGEVGLPVIRIKQLLDPNEPVDRSETDTPDRCLLRDGDIVFSWSGTLAVRIWNRGPAKLNQHLFRVVEKKNVYKGIIPLILDHAIEELEEKSHGTTMKHITKQTLLPHKVLLPPLQEQIRIVEIISAMDIVANQTQLAITEAQSLRSGLLSDLLSGEHEIPVTYDKVMGAA